MLGRYFPDSLFICSHYNFISCPCMPYCCHVTSETAEKRCGPIPVPLGKRVFLWFKWSIAYKQRTVHFYLWRGFSWEIIGLYFNDMFSNQRNLASTYQMVYSLLREIWWDVRDMWRVGSWENVPGLHGQRPVLYFNGCLQRTTNNLSGQFASHLNQ